MTTIKITELTDIGANLASTTVLPVVNMTGTPTTEKTVLGNIANVILAGAGGNYVAAAKATTATTANTVITAAQPNVTSVGTLTGLTSNGVVNFANTSNVTLGAVSNVHISGGTSGYVLQTDGAGILSWVAQSGGGGSYGNSNVAAYLPTYTGNISAGNVAVTSNVSVGNVIATGNLYSTGLLSNGVANVNSNVVSTNPNTGALKVRGGLGVVGNVHSGGEIHSAGNVIVGGQSLFVGPSADATGLTNPTIIAFHGGEQYIQAALKNSLSTGSADWVAYGDNGTDSQGWADFGFTSSEFDDPAYTITGAGDGYFFVETFAGSYGGNLVIATGSEGTVRDIIFATGGFTANAEFARISDGNNSFELTRTGASLTFPDGSVQTTAYTGGGGGNPFDQELNTTDNVEFANITSTDAIRFVNSGNVVGALGYAPTFVSIEGYQSNSVNITANDIYTWSFDNNGVLSKNDANGLVLAANYSAQIITDFGDNDRTWLFDGSSGELVLPGGNVLIDPTDDNFEVRGAQAVNFEANTVVNIYTDTSNSAYQWQFGDDGNLTLPGNNSSINYANGTPYGGGGSGYIIPYEVATFVANTKPGFGEIQFADNEGANSAPATAQKLFINNSPTNEQSLGTIFQQWTSNSYRGTLSLNNGSDSQATFNISNGRIYFEPETYRGFQAGLNQIWGDDCSINQLIITNATAPKFYNTDFLVEEDVFHASGLATGNTHVMLNIYGSSQYNPINPNDLWNTFVAFVDNVLYDNTTLRTNPDDIKTQFYNNTGSFRNNIPTQDLYQYFRFTSSSDADYFGTAPTTTNGSGTGATVRIRVNPNNTYTVLGTALPGVGYIGGETLTVLGTDLGGATPANDLTILIASVDGDGVITAVSYDSGTGVYPWPTNRISDGGDDQYDTGNYLNTNLASEISYANGITQTASAAFGGGDYCVMYYQSFFCMVATGVSSSVSDLFYSGDLGFDGDGALNWTGLRSNQSVIANNNALYAYFDSEYLDGELTPTVGTTYNMVLDSAGINLDGFYAYNDPDSNDHYFGSNTDWRLESQSQLFVQSYNEMIIQTLVNQRGIGETGPALTVQAGDGSPGQKEINATAGNGGTVYVRGGDAGGSDGIDSLGNTGGRVEISGGVGSGNSQAGNVEINGGEGNNSGSINLRTDYGSNSTGKITLNTGGNGTTNTWEFRPDGSTIFPTLTVDIHNGGNQQAQTLQFGDNTQQAIITGPTPDVTGSAQRLIIQGQRGSGTGEGGDVYLWAGDSDLYGGDIKIYAGDADNVSSGSGGYVNIAGGDGFDGGGYVSMTAGQSSNGAGASASVTGGFGNTVGGEANIRGGGGTVAGGSASILGGYGSGGPGGNVTIIGGGSGNGLAEYGNINLSAGAGTWIFGNDGNLILAGGNSIVRSVANSSLDPINPNISTMVLTPDPGYSSQSLVLDPTSPGHIHLRAPSANIDEPFANIFLGGEDSSFEVGYYNGSAPNVFIHSGGNTWEFLNDGNLVFPRDAVGNTDPFLRITGGASPRILAEDVSLAGPANLEITALNTIFTGSSGSAIKIYADDGEIGSTANLQLWTNSGGNTEYSWTFGNDGNLTTSSNLVISPSGIGTGTAIAQTDAPLQIASTDANGSASIGWYGNPTGPGNVVQVALNQTGGSMTVTTGDYSDTTYVWDFDNTGNLTLPTGGVINYANGSPYGGSSVAEASFSIQTANFNANAGSRYGVDTSGGAVTATLPASPATGAAIFFADAGGAYASNNLTIARNGQTIMGASSDLTVSTNNQSVGLFYNGTTWRTYNAG